MGNRNDISAKRVARPRSILRQYRLLFTDSPALLTSSARGRSYEFVIDHFRQAVIIDKRLPGATIVKFLTELENGEWEQQVDRSPAKKTKTAKPATAREPKGKPNPYRVVFTSKAIDLTDDTGHVRDAVLCDDDRLIFVSTKLSEARTREVIDQCYASAGLK